MPDLDTLRIAERNMHQTRRYRDRLVRELYEDGVSVAAIASALTMTRKGVYLILERTPSGRTAARRD